jgi:hypothetical protein
MRGGPVPTGTFDSSPVRSAGKWYRRHVRPGRDDRNARGPVSHPMSRARISHSIVHSGTHRFLENATQHFVLGYFPMSLRDLSLLTRSLWLRLRRADEGRKANFAKATSAKMIF